MDISVDEVSNFSREQKIEFLTQVVDSEEFILSDLAAVLKRLAHDEDAEVRELAVTALWDYPDKGTLDLLLELAEKDPSLEVRSSAVVTLGRFIYEGIVENYDEEWVLDDTIIPGVGSISEKDFLRVKRYLLSLARDERKPLELRRFAIESLSFLSDEEVVDLIRKAYEHPDLNMKVSALFAMGRNGNESWANILLKELESQVPELQYEATRAAGEFSLREGIEILKRLANSKDKDLALKAIWALGRTGGQGVRPFLERYTRDRDPDVRDVAKAALEELELVEIAEGIDDFTWEDWEESEEDSQEDDEQ